MKIVIFDPKMLLKMAFFAFFTIFKSIKTPLPKNGISRIFLNVFIPFTQWRKHVPHMCKMKFCLKLPLYGFSWLENTDF